MNREKTNRFLNLLVRQIAGDESVIDEIRSLDISQSDGQCLFNLFGEWSGAFSYCPGRIDALQPLLKLLQWLAESARDDVARKYSRSEWASLVEMRGPVETVLIRTCSNCDFESVSMGTSGFYDAVGLLCVDCGNVYFKSYYDDSTTPACNCGGRFQQSRPDCGVMDHRSKCVEMSPYQYYESHSFVRGDGA